MQLGKRLSNLHGRRTGFLLRRCLPIGGVALYELVTLWHIYSYLMSLALRSSGEHYFAYEVFQTKVNFWVRVPSATFPLFESLFLGRMIGADSSLHPGIFLYSFWEIAVLDLVLGPLVWLLVLTLVGAALARHFPD